MKLRSCRHCVNVGSVQVVETSFQTQTTLLELPQLLVTQRHIVEECQCVGVIAVAPAELHHVEHAVSFLKQSKCLLVVVPFNMLEGADV